MKSSAVINYFITSICYVYKELWYFLLSVPFNILKKINFLVTAQQCGNFF